LSPTDWNPATIAKLAWADGYLYASTDKGILAVSQYGGAPKILVPDEPAASELWIQGDDLLYAVKDRLMKVPRAGGTASIVVDGALTNTEEDQGAYIGGGHIYDGTFFYWAIGHQDSSLMHIWRIPLAGGAREGHAPIHYFSDMVLVADGVLAANYGYGGDAQVAPLGQTTGRRMNRDSNMQMVISIDSGGALWSSTMDEEVELSPADGSTWHSLTSMPGAFWAYPDGKGGHFLANRERFDDDIERLSIWFVTPGGKAKRLACSPSDGYGGLAHTAALAPDALYLVQEKSTIMKIARDPKD
jgi:hypothetical protein